MELQKRGIVFFKWVADEWMSYAKQSKAFDLQVLNYTGVLDRQTLQQRMSLFLA